MVQPIDDTTGSIGSVGGSAADRVRWRNVWTAGVQYEKNDMVYDSTWLMIANKATIDRAAPQVAGPPVDGIIGDPLWSFPTSTGVIYSGQQYTFTDPGRLATAKVWVPTIGLGISHRVFLRDVTAGVETAITTEIASFVPIEDGWYAISLGGALVDVGAILQVFLSTKNVSGATVTNADWTHEGVIGPPQPGGWKRDQFQYDVFYVADLDDSGTDRTALFASMRLGDTFEFVDSTDPNKIILYELTETPEEAVGMGYFSFRGIPVDIGAGGVPAFGVLSNAEITQDITISVDYVNAVDYWLTHDVPFADVEGILEIDGVAQSAIADNAYGVDLIFRGGDLSPDWDLASNITTVG